MSKIFKSKKPSVETRVTQIPEYQKVRKAVSNKLIGYINSAAPQYSGERVAPFSADETAYFQRARELANRTGLPESYVAARKQISDTLSGAYDPTTSLYYKAMRDAAAYNLQNTMKQIADQAAGGGRYWAGARLKQQQEAATQVNNRLNSILGNLALQERQNQLNVLPYAMQMGRIEEVLPLQRADILGQIGQAQRMLEQERLDKLYADWLFRNVDWPYRWLSAGLGMIQGEPISIQNIVHRGSPSLFGRIMQPISTAIGYGIGGPIGSAIGSGISGIFNKGA